MESQKKLKILIFALAAYGKGLSGGDRIFIEFARRWSKKYPVTIYCWEEGYQMCVRQGLNSKLNPFGKLRIDAEQSRSIKTQNSKLKYHISKMESWKHLGFIINYVARIVEGIKLAYTLKLEPSLQNIIIYSASEFWMDSLPAFILKLRFPKIKWVAAWYQTAPNPRERRGSVFYWFVQLLIKPIISKFADFVLVNNEEEKKQFSKHNRLGKAIVVLGAVDMKKIGNWKLEIGKLPKVHDAVFQGRFHPQKGALELVDIWKKVVEKKPDAKLAMIGDGSLMQSVKLKVKSEKLENNIKLFGWMFDGQKKYKIFSQSKIVVHPALYDSGEMAAAEAMAFGLPAVGFNLKSYESYYPKGMIKVTIGDLDEFAGSIIGLMNNEKKRVSLGNEAEDSIKKNFTWDKRAEEVLTQII